MDPQASNTKIATIPIWRSTANLGGMDLRRRNLILVGSDTEAPPYSRSLAHIRSTTTVHWSQVRMIGCQAEYSDSSIFCNFHDPERYFFHFLNITPVWSHETTYPTRRTEPDDVGRFSDLL